MEQCLVSPYHLSRMEKQGSWLPEPGHHIHYFVKLRFYTSPIITGGGSENDTNSHLLLLTQTPPAVTSKRWPNIVSVSGWQAYFLPQMYMPTNNGLHCPNLFWDLFELKKKNPSFKMQLPLICSYDWLNLFYWHSKSTDGIIILPIMGSMNQSIWDGRFLDSQRSEEDTSECERKI